MRDADKPGIVGVARELVAMGFSIVATRGTAAGIEAAGIAVEVVNKVLEGRPHIVDMIKNDRIQLIINTTEGRQAIADSSAIRSSAQAHDVYYTTTLAGGEAVLHGIAPRAGCERAVPAGNTQGARLMVTRVPMTVEGAERLRAELEQLKRVDRPRISKAIAEAREHGDLKENAEYHAAREQQSFAEGRINDIEAKLSAAQIIDIRSITYSRASDLWRDRRDPESRDRREAALPDRG